MKYETGYGWISLVLLGAVTSLGACAPRSTLDAYFEKMQKDDPVGYAEMVERRRLRDAQQTPVRHVSISCFNHGDYGASSFAVEEVAHGQISRGMVGGPFGCGGDLGLGYPLPLKWRPGLKVRVRWNTYAPGATEPTRHEQSTTIRPYDRLGTVYVHFFPGDQVRIVVANNGPTSSTHPISRNTIVPPPEIE